MAVSPQPLVLHLIMAFGAEIKFFVVEILETTRKVSQQAGTLPNTTRREWEAQEGADISKVTHSVTGVRAGKRVCAF